MESRENTHHVAFVIEVILKMLIAITLFILGFMISWGSLFRPLNEEEFKACEQVAREMYFQRNQSFIPQKEGFSIQRSSTSVAVTSSNPFNIGKVIAESRNGEVILERDMQTENAIIISILIGILFLLLGIATKMIITEKVNKKLIKPVQKTK